MGETGGQEISGLQQGCPILHLDSVKDRAPVLTPASTSVYSSPG